jgi:phage shock protein B
LADEEAKMIQEIYHGLTQMEARVEALETLLLEKEKKDS